MQNVADLLIFRRAVYLSGNIELYFISFGIVKPILVTLKIEYTA